MITIKPLLMILVAAACCAAMLPSGGRNAEAAGKTAVQTTASAPQFSTKTVQGAWLSSAKLAGKGYIVNFFGSWCPYCRKEIPEMVALQQKYEKQGFTFVGIAYKDSEQAMPDFIWEHAINYPVIMANETILNSFGRSVQGGVSGVPMLFAVDRSGRLVSVVSGIQTKEEFEAIILKTLKKP